MPNIINATRKKVKSYLKVINRTTYPKIFQEIADIFVIQRGSAVVQLSVKPLTKDDCIVETLAYVVTGARITPKLMTMLLRNNANYPVGAYALQADDTIIFKHSMAGANLDINELRIAVATVAFVADEDDDVIVKLAGGYRAVDANANLVSLAPPASPEAKKAPAKTVKAAGKKKS